MCRPWPPSVRWAHCRVDDLRAGCHASDNAQQGLHRLLLSSEQVLQGFTGHAATACTLRLCESSPHHVRCARRTSATAAIAAGFVPLDQGTACEAARLTQCAWTVGAGVNPTARWLRVAQAKSGCGRGPEVTDWGRTVFSVVRSPCAKGQNIMLANPAHQPACPLPDVCAEGLMLRLDVCCVMTQSGQDKRNQSCLNPLPGLLHA